MKIYSNIVPEDKVREVQRETLGIISEALCRSFGPKGSTTAFVKNIDQNGANISVEHTKDGHTIVKNIQFVNPIERSVQDMLTELTRYVVKEVGDGTTSAIILCKTVFDCLCEDERIMNNTPSDTLRRISETIKELNERILAKARECTIDDIYNIALISTNNNEYISQTLRSVYERYGLDVYIDVGVANGTDCIVKEYDGMTMDTGFTDICFVNDSSRNAAVISNPKIYCFNDPIDTPEMISFLDAILEHNIIRAYKAHSVYEPIPTVIFCKAITPDTSSYFESIVKLMNANPGSVPLLIVSDIHQEYLYEDIAKMCGAPFIKKYLNPDIQEEDIKNGLAPTKETIVEFCGGAEQVVSDQLKTKIIRPVKMFDENGNYSTEYNIMLKYLETQVKKAQEENAGVDEIARTKKRLNCFKGNMVDFLIGGLTLADRNNLKASVEDAVLNCRSAASNGVGYGANYMAFSTLNEMKNEEAGAVNPMVNIFFEAYYNLISILYGKSYDKEDVKEILLTSLSKGQPLNIRTNDYDGKVLSSIKSDIAVLETIDKILSLMFTCNQYLLQTPAYNVYSPRDDE